ncbi:4-coumarate--CoA ligase, putative [Entamoeba invadens IP1]|uniref:4-coumarate--CoA ligase, putative n=1 Tax=Entamoeba invadens IP1 TaxID=370355 RepID=A0A0A1U5M1_ENTIV|nr:4-coumarate--CoA ligase, putative [Entamoeba invadens IP1]ELP89612.1 4-coumarate--CoA ligase, putative [Entamoeba invadens IP1]|eukprot:XP_004256383.1 4-coumarate--CoA ligase, putative [Entamoeba invadens IP1]
MASLSSPTHLDESHLVGSTKIPLQDTTYPKHFLSTVTANPDRECLVFRSAMTKANIRHTYSQLLEKVNRIIQGFSETIKIPHQSVVAIYLPNVLEYIYAELASVCGGYIFMPLNPLYTKPQLERLLPRVKPSIVVTMMRMLPNLPKAEGCSFVLIDQQVDVVPENCFLLHDFLNIQSKKNYVESVAQTLKSSEFSFYGCTSGSTGEPKICVYSHFAMVNPFLTMDMSYNVPVNIRVALCFTPLFTTAAHFQIDAIFAVGAKVIVVDKFEPVSIMQFIVEEHVTNFNCAPSGVLAVLHHPNFSKEKFETIKHVVMGGAVVPDALLKEAKEKMDLITCKSGYGMTELCGVMYTMSLTEGQVQGHYELRIVDHTTRKTTPVGVPGEIEVRTKIMMSGYLNNPTANKESYTEDGWFKTGDEGCLDKHGRMLITGRVKEMIIRGGHNVFPAEIIDTLQKHPDVIMAGCVSVPDRAQGEMIIAFVTLKNEIMESELKEWCKNRLVSFAVPTHIFVLEKMPLTSFGKVYAPELRKLAIENVKKFWENVATKNINKPDTEAGKKIANLWSQWFDIPEGAISKDTNFFDVGGDSLVGTQTVGLIKQFVSDAPFDLLTKCPTLGMLEEYVKNPKLELIHPQFKIDLEQIDESVNKFSENKGSVHCDKKIAFLTGANGFLGIHLLQELQRAGYVVICLVRSQSIGDGIRRITQAANSTGVTIQMENIEVVLGDVSKPNCGIVESEYNSITQRISVVIHNAAYVNWNRSYNDMRESNYIGTQNVFKLCSLASGVFLYVSSIGVAAAVSGIENTPDITKLPYKANGYIQTKWMSEVYLNRLREKGYKIGILRPAFITGNSKSGCCNTDDFIWKYIRVLVKNGITVDSQTLMMTPVNLVAEAFVKAIPNPPIAANLVPKVPTQVHDICTLFADILKVKIENLKIEDVKAKLAEIAKCGNKEVLSLIPSLQVTGLVNSQAGWLDTIEFDLSENAESLKHSVNYLLKSGFFGEEYADGKTQCVGRAAV